MLSGLKGFHVQNPSKHRFKESLVDASTLSSPGVCLVRFSEPQVKKGEGRKLELW